MAHAQNDGSIAFAQGIAMLERLLADVNDSRQEPVLHQTLTRDAIS